MQVAQAHLTRYMCIVVSLATPNKAFRTGVQASLVCATAVLFTTVYSGPGHSEPLHGAAEIGSCLTRTSLKPA